MGKYIHCPDRGLCPQCSVSERETKEVTQHHCPAGQVVLKVVLAVRGALMFASVHSRLMK